MTLLFGGQTANVEIYYELFESFKNKKTVGFNYKAEISVSFNTEKPEETKYVFIAPIKKITQENNNHLLLEQSPYSSEYIMDLDEFERLTPEKFNQFLIYLCKDDEKFLFVCKYWSIDEFVDTKIEESRLKTVDYHKYWRKTTKLKGLVEVYILEDIF